MHPTWVSKAPSRAGCKASHAAVRRSNVSILRGVEGFARSKHSDRVLLCKCGHVHLFI